MPLNSGTEAFLDLSGAEQNIVYYLMLEVAAYGEEVRVIKFCHII